MDFRAIQCQDFDNIPFLGREYQWKPYYDGEKFSWINILFFSMIIESICIIFILVHAFADDSFFVYWYFIMKISLSQLLSWHSIYLYFRWIDNQCLYIHIFSTYRNMNIYMDNISLEIYYLLVFTDNGTYQRENQTSLWFLISC